MAFDSTANIDLVDADLLPTQVRYLVRLIGMTDTFRLLKARGGLPTYIAATIRGNVLLGIISKASVERLADSDMAGRYIDLPKIDKIVMQLRDRYVVSEIESGRKNGRQMASELDITYRTVKLIKNRCRTENKKACHQPTGDLFIDNNCEKSQAN